MEKKALRKYIRSCKAGMTEAERQRQSAEVCLKVLDTPQWKAARTVLLYHALPDELDTRLLLDTFGGVETCNGIVGAKRLLLPVVDGDVLQLREYTGLLAEGEAYHIMEPTAASPLFTDYASIDLAIIPGMAFDSQGHRLGRGKGYYDKLLCQCPDLYKIGVCFDYQLLPEVPSEAHDILMNLVISGK